MLRNWLLNHPNPWFERQLRSILVSAKNSGQNVDDITSQLSSAALAKETTLVTHRLRALWTLHALGETSPEMLRSFLAADDEHLRVWSIRLLTDSQPMDTGLGPRMANMPKPLPTADINKFVELAKTDSSGLVRLALASALQRLPLGVGKRPRRSR